MNHLTIEQCKKLKEIGFPQDTAYFHYADYEIVGRENNYETIGHKYILQHGYSEVPITNIAFPRDRYSCPTMEELIEWLGDDFVDLQLPSKEEGFYSTSIHNSSKGDTHLEAVYNLAIAINTPNPNVI